MSAGAGGFLTQGPPQAHPNPADTLAPAGGRRNEVTEGERARTTGRKEDARAIALALPGIGLYLGKFEIRNFVDLDKNFSSQEIEQS